MVLNRRWQLAALVTLCLLVRLVNSDSGFSSCCECTDFCQGTSFCQVSPNGTVVLQNFNDQLGEIQSSTRYVYGTFTVRAKLPAGYSGGIITTMYLTSLPHSDFTTPHDEIDFEFLGSSTPQNMTIHTNLFSGGQNMLEQYSFPFDPSADFHNYTIIWTHGAIAWLIDGTPIRLTTKKRGHPFPILPMEFHATMWNAHWLSLQPNYSNGPLLTTFSSFEFTGCQSHSLPSFLTCLRSRDLRLPWMVPLGADGMAAMADFQRSHTLAKHPWQPVTK